MLVNSIKNLLRSLVNELLGFNLNLGWEYWSSSQDANFTQNAWVVKNTLEVSSYSSGKLTEKGTRFIRRF
jgi:predicted negative regulator of RcsB-dependent stress response